MTLKPWREIVVPHEDVLRGTFQQAEFAADLSRVHERTATTEYVATLIRGAQAQPPRLSPPLLPRSTAFHTCSSKASSAGEWAPG